jgi:adenylate cyclase
MMRDDFTMEERVVLFTDIHNYSLTAMNLGDDQYAFLQEVYDDLGDLIVGHQGEIIKYLGDALLCLFPADGALEAITCSLKLRRAYAAIVDRRRIPIQTDLEIGLDLGRVAVGVFGHESLRQRDVFGEAVNLAATIGHHRGVAVTESVYRKIQQAFPTRELPATKVKWREDPVRVWEVVE